MAHMLLQTHESEPEEEISNRTSELYLETIVNMECMRKGHPCFPLILGDLSHMKARVDIYPTIYVQQNCATSGAYLLEIHTTSQSTSDSSEMSRVEDRSG